ncbi:MAG TPA: thiosulfate sulfurtransferase GlpE [Pseudomonadales bacterium]|nr:thiosulfate sulfurtransferase GlpE [Pseudomonadales bacterium]
MSFTCIPAAAAKQMMDSGDVTIVDIRDPSSFAAAHVPGSFSLNNNNVSEFVAQADHDKPLLVFCYHGHSSQGAADFLAGQGFREVYSVDGGVEGWKMQYPVTA